MIIERRHENCDDTEEYKTGFENITEQHKKHKGERVIIDLPYEQSANALMSAKGYVDYVKKHGYHFTEALAEHVSRSFINADGSSHNWTAAQIRRTLQTLGLVVSEDKVTIGDMTYLANMYYSDFYPEPLKDESSCLKAAYKIATDLDGYKGMIFCRWTADAIGKSISIDWEKFI